MKFKYRPISNKKQIGKKRSYDDIKYIVIHDTGNSSKGADAENHLRYLNGATRYGSAHYYLDDKEIIQTIGDSFVAWSIGDKWGYANNPNRIKNAYNSNSISIELCINSDIDQEKAYKNLVELTKNLMVKFKVPIERVIRHFDATGKICPGSWSKNNWSKWWQFKEDIKKPIEWQIDLSKDSEFGTLESNKISKVKEEKKMEKDYKGHWAEKQIDEVLKKEIMTGFDDGTFRPDKEITRAEVAVVVSRLLKKN
ncbi:N-acetylmuramoyl-L-alanine amidase [Peptoniphilus sp. MSJ-1]|uniref:N-acetylmuramoyl-L-alanine amidase n=1 Tax=Peptoniphilus ovalis TaxID=2841503 RepID=A0ABS6FH30_9FIRM|nr:N-acetylmuramoyl-L-alanine amidase [Peptoniphilus ovalis]MBU5669485.1 N-acetylmuramoyl-L-alanine amidase [Peptoniphilus ovalis]